MTRNLKKRKDTARNFSPNNNFQRTQKNVTTYKAITKEMKHVKAKNKCA